MAEEEAPILTFSPPVSADPSSISDHVYKGQKHNIKGDEVLEQEKSQEFIGQLIAWIQKVPILYDHSHRQYRHSGKKFEAWNYVKQKVGYLGEPQELADYWKLIRDRYTKARKKVASNKPTKFLFLKELKFLDPHITDRSSWYAKDSNGKTTKHTKSTSTCNGDFTLRLINLVRDNPCFYNTADPNYRKFEHKYQVWNKIAEELNFAGTYHDMYKQWKKIRDRYVREMRKIRLNGRDRSTCKWQYFKDMEWIGSFLDETRPSAPYEVRVQPEEPPVTKTIYSNGRKKAEIKILKPARTDSFAKPPPSKKFLSDMPKLTPEMPRLMPQVMKQEERELPFSEYGVTSSPMLIYRAPPQTSIIVTTSQSQSDIEYFIEQGPHPPEEYILTSALPHQYINIDSHEDGLGEILEDRDALNYAEIIFSSCPEDQTSASTNIVYTITRDTDLSTLPDNIRQTVEHLNRKCT